MNLLSKFFAPLMCHNSLMKKKSSLSSQSSFDITTSEEKGDVK